MEILTCQRIDEIIYYKIKALALKKGEYPFEVQYSVSLLLYYKDCYHHAGYQLPFNFESFQNHACRTK